MMVQYTEKYELFKVIDGNRNIIPAHVKKLAEEIKKRNLTEYMPILVNERMEVIDGQHRLEALKMLGNTIPFVVCPGGNLSVVQELNSTSKSWKPLDYVESYIKLGNENYAILLDFYYRYNLPLTMCAELLMGFNVATGGTMAKMIREGKFVAKNKRFAESFATFIAEFRKHINKRLTTDRNLLAAFIKVLKIADMDIKQFVHKIKIYGHTLKRQACIEDYLRELEKLYNLKSRTEHKRLF